MRLPIFLILLGYVISLPFVTKAQYLTIKDIRANAGYHLIAPNDHNPVYTFCYRIHDKRSNTSRFRIVEFDSLVRVKDTTVVSVANDYKILSAIKTKTDYVLLLGSSSFDNQLILSVNRESKRQNVGPLLIPGSWSAGWHYELIGSPDQSAFIFLKQSDKKHTWLLQGMNEQLKIQWTSMVYDSKAWLTLTNRVLQADRLVINFGKNIHKRKGSRLVKVWDATDGLVKAEHHFADSLKARSIDHIFYKDDSTLLLVGRIYPGKKISNTDNGVSYVRKLNLQRGSVSDDKILSEGYINLNKIWWMDYVEPADGEAYLIGESFKSDSFGTHLARAVFSGLFTFGLAYLDYTAIQFKDIVILPLQDLQPSKSTVLQIAPTKYTHRGYVPPYLIVKFARDNGVSRYWGLDHQRNPYFLNGTLISKYDLSAKSLVNMGKVINPSQSMVIKAMNKNLLIYTKSGLRATVEFRLYPINSGYNEASN